MWAIQGNVEVLGEVGDEDDVDDAGGGLVLVRRALPTSPSCSSYFLNSPPEGQGKSLKSIAKVTVVRASVRPCVRPSVRPQ